MVSKLDAHEFLVFLFLQLTIALGPTLREATSDKRFVLRADRCVIIPLHGSTEQFLKVHIRHGKPPLDLMMGGLGNFTHSSLTMTYVFVHLSAFSSRFAHPTACDMI